MAFKERLAQTSQQKCRSPTLDLTQMFLLSHLATQVNTQKGCIIIGFFELLNMTTMCNQFLTVDLLMYPPLVPIVPCSVIKSSYFFNSGFLLKQLFSVTRFLKNCWLPFLKDLQGFNLSAGSLVRLPKDCDARLILARQKLPGTFTYYYWSCRPGEPSAIVESRKVLSSVKITPHPPLLV